MKLFKRTILLFLFSLFAYFLVACSTEARLKSIKVSGQIQVTSTGAEMIATFNDKDYFLFNTYSSNPVARVYFKQSLYDDNNNEKVNPTFFRSTHITKNRREGNYTISDKIRFNDLYYIPSLDKDKPYAEWAQRPKLELELRISVVTDSGKDHVFFKQSFEIETDADPVVVTIGSKAELNYHFLADKQETMKDPIDFSKNVIYKLTSNIDMGGQEFSSLTGTHDFLGVFDGDDYTISNFKLVMSSSTTHSGFIAKNLGTIKNLKLKNVTFAYNNSAYSGSYGFFAGVNNGVIENCKLENATLDYTITETFSGSNDKSRLYIGFICGSMQPVDLDVITAEHNLGLINNLVVNSKMNILIADPKDVYIGGIVGYLGSQLNNRLKYSYIVNKNSVDDLSSITLDQKVANADSEVFTLGVGGVIGYANQDFYNVVSKATLNIKASYDYLRPDSEPEQVLFPDKPSAAYSPDANKPSIDRKLRQYDVYVAGIAGIIGKSLETIHDAGFAGTINASFDKAYNLYSALAFAYAYKNELGLDLDLKNIYIGLKTVTSLNQSFVVKGNTLSEIKQVNPIDAYIAPIKTSVNHGQIFASTEVSLKVVANSNIKGFTDDDYKNRITVEGSLDPSNIKEYTTKKPDQNPDTNKFSEWLKSQLGL